MPTFQHILDALKLAPRYLAAISVACAFLLFTHAAVLQWLHVADFAQNNRQWVSLVFISTTILFLVDRATEVRRIYRDRQITAEAEKRRLKRLNALTEEEKQILRFYIAKQTRTNYLRIGDGVVQGLEASGIIYQAHSIGDVLDGFAYNITEFAWEYLQKHHALLDGATNTYKTDIKRTRPMVVEPRKKERRTSGSSGPGQAAGFRRAKRSLSSTVSRSLSRYLKA